MANDADQESLVVDTSISYVSPIVRGTRITAWQVLARLDDGRTWREILDTYPELKESDIRDCIAYGNRKRG